MDCSVKIKDCAAAINIAELIIHISQLVVTVKAIALKIQMPRFIPLPYEYILQLKINYFSFLASANSLLILVDAAFMCELTSCEAANAPPKAQLI